MQAYIFNQWEFMYLTVKLQRFRSYSYILYTLINILYRIQRQPIMIESPYSNNPQSHTIPILKQSTIVQMVHSLKNATTQSQISQLQSDIKLLFAHEKNLSVLTSVMLSKELQRQYKIVLISFYRLLVQECLLRFQHLNFDSKSKRASLQLDNLRKHIITLSNKIQKIIDCTQFPVSIKPQLIVLLLKLHSRRSQDWNSAKLPNKMQFYFRKGYILLANAYFVNMIKYSFSARQKLLVYRKTMTYLPTCAANSLIKVIKGQGYAQNQYKFGGYQDFKCALNAISNVLSTVYLQFSKELVLNWCNLDVFIAMIKTVAQELYNYEEKGVRKHPEEDIKQWHQLLLKILKKLSNYIECRQFVQIFQNYTEYIIRDKYLKLQIDQSNTYEQRIGQYLQILTNLTRLKTCPSLILSLSPSQSSLQSLSSSLQSSSFTLPMSQKLHFLKTSIFPLYSYFIMKTNYFLAKQCSAEEQTAYLQMVDQFFSINQTDHDHESQNLMENFVAFFRTNVQSMRQIGYYIKNLIYTLLFSLQTNTDNKSSTSYLQTYLHNKDQQQILHELPSQFYGNPAYKIQIGMLLCMVLYPYLSKDRQFVNNCVGQFITQVANSTGQNSIFCRSHQTITIFMVMFRNYLCQLPLSTKSNSMRLQSFKFSSFVSNLSQYLCMRTTSQTNLLQILIHFLLHYIRLTKQIIVHYKKSKLYASYCDSLGFPQLQGPLKQFHMYQNNIPIQYCCLLYVQLVDYDIFRIQGQTQSQTIARLSSVLSRMVQHNNASTTNYNKNMDNVSNTSGILGVMRNTRGILKVMQAVLACEQYTPIFQLILQWLLTMKHNTLWLRSYQEDLIDVCLVLLNRPSLLAGADGKTVSMFWQLVQTMLCLYEWSQQSIDQFHTNTFPPQSSSHISSHSHSPQQSQSSSSYSTASSSSLTHKQLLLMYRTSTFITPLPLLHKLLQTSTQSLTQINKYMNTYRNKMKIFKVRPYQLCQIGHLLVLHQIIILRYQELGNREIQGLLQLFWSNLMYRRLYLTQFNYVHGKYSLIIVLLLKYKFNQFISILLSKPPQIGHQILYQTFYQDHQYRVCYDSPMYVMHALDIIQYIWHNKCQEKGLELVLKYVHFLVGGTVLCLDRIYQYYRYCRQEHMEISCLSVQLQNPTHSTNKWITNFVQYLTANDAEVDQFQRFRQFYRKLVKHEALRKWFYDFMLLYFQNQSYLMPYYETFMIRKIKRSDGMYIYRIFRKYVRPT